MGVPAYFEALEAEVIELRAFKRRVLEAVNDIPDPVAAKKARDNLRLDVARDLLNGASMRGTAAKHGTTLGIVRGIYRDLKASTT